MTTGPEGWERKGRKRWPVFLPGGTVGRMDEAYLARARERRERMVGGAAQTFSELERRGIEYWQTAPPEARLAAIHQLLFDAWILKGRDGPPPRFDGSTGGTLRFER